MRLRAYTGFLKLSGATLFQFLLVRLRGAKNAPFIYFFKNISIPSGAIKRVVICSLPDALARFQFLLVRLRAPTIFNISHVNDMIFQFLLVRLRVSLQARVVNCTSAISIPSGAIKRALQLCQCLKSFIFQFLLVRLRVIAATFV